MCELDSLENHGPATLTFGPPPLVGRKVGEDVMEGHVAESLGVMGLAVGSKSLCELRYKKKQSSI